MDQETYKTLALMSSVGFVVSTIACSSPRLETAVKGILGAMFSVVVAIALAVTNWEGFKHATHVALPIYAIPIVIGLLSWWSPFERYMNARQSSAEPSPGAHGNAYRQHGPAQSADYYRREVVALDKVIPGASQILPDPFVRELCVNLYFNWLVTSFERGDDYLTVTLSRRGDTMSKRYPCQPQLVSALTPPLI
ncbi:hypothetical protein H8F21_14080 [Pseudomonas sp. P66]|uniref:Uncharacterized protein n=1 Tax=Pseudomonas arcuscaelestis TaxID=2710591 RepID=A0ABS2C046_9PSED|nr:hypothetical protein [Pseudomonas arcuscaelestis]MBM5458693.1 hypothetical protein [Pseudomonas arcuscaelestis]